MNDERPPLEIIHEDVDEDIVVWKYNHGRPTNLTRETNELRSKICFVSSSVRASLASQGSKETIKISSRAKSLTAIEYSILSVPLVLKKDEFCAEETTQCSGTFGSIHVKHWKPHNLTVVRKMANTKI